MRIVEDYPIRPGAENHLTRRIDTKSRTVGDVNYPPTFDDISERTLNRAGLRQHLSMLAHGPLSPFEEGLIATWGNDPMDILTPLIRIGGRGVYGYLLDAGGSGGRTRTLYSARGDAIRVSNREAPLVNMGLGPIDYFMLATAAIALGRFLVRRAIAKRATPTVRKGPNPDQEALTLREQIVLEEAKAGGGREIMSNLADTPRLVANYGRGNWVKMEHVQKFSDGGQVNVHWFRNKTTGQNVEFKFKIRDDQGTLNR